MMGRKFFYIILILLIASSCSKKPPQKINYSPQIIKFTSNFPSATVNTKSITFEVEAVDPNGDPMLFTWSVSKVDAQGNPIPDKPAGTIESADPKKGAKWYLPAKIIVGDRFKISVNVCDIYGGRPKSPAVSSSIIIEVTNTAEPTISDLRIEGGVNIEYKITPTESTTLPCYALMFNAADPDTGEEIISYKISYTSSIGGAKLLTPVVEDGRLKRYDDIQNKEKNISSPSESVIIDLNTKDDLIPFIPTDVGKYTITLEIKNSKSPPETKTDEVSKNFTILAKEPIKNYEAWGIGSAFINAQIFVFGGINSISDNKSNLNKNMVYDISTSPGSSSPWLEKSSLPEARSSFAYTSYQNKIYVIGGWSSNGATNTVFVYDTVSNAWAQETASPTKRYGSSAVTVRLDNKDYIYVIGGFDGNNQPLNTVERYDIANKSWEKVSPSLPTKRGGLISCVLSDGLIDYIYAIGGQGDGGVTEKVERLNLYRNRWEEVSSLNIPRSGAGCVVVNNKIYVLGGLDKTLQPTNSVEEFSGGVWQRKITLPTPRYNLTACSNNNIVYILGGTEGTRGLNIFEQWLVE